MDFTLKDYNKLLKSIKNLKLARPLPKLTKLRLMNNNVWTFEDENGNFPIGAIFSEEIKNKILNYSKNVI